MLDSEILYQTDKIVAIKDCDGNLITIGRQCPWFTKRIAELHLTDELKWAERDLLDDNNSQTA